jgi:TFIIF-interacting CTD phosphatase-like protein
MGEDPKLLVLDLDETLVFAEAGLTPCDFTVGPFGVRKRPHVDAFLAQARESFRLAVWTAAGSEYARGVIDLLFGREHALEFLWTSERCTIQYDPELHEQVSVKRLGKLRRQGWDLRKVLVVDDSPEKHVHNWGNLVWVAPFIGDAADRELLHLGSYLATLKDVPDVRAVDKRGWRGRWPSSS